MTESLVPESLLGLPAPWNRLELDPREEVEISDQARAAALDVLDRCLRAVEALPKFITDEAFPEWVTVAWGLWNGVFEKYFRTFDGFRLERILESFRKQDPDLDTEMARRYAQAWLRHQAMDRLYFAQDWLVKSLRKEPHEKTLRAMQDIVRARWRADEIRTFSLLWNLSTLDREGTADLLRHIAASPDASPELAERIRQLLRDMEAGPA